MTGLHDRPLVDPDGAGQTFDIWAPGVAGGVTPVHLGWVAPDGDDRTWWAEGTWDGRDGFRTADQAIGWLNGDRSSW